MTPDSHGIAVLAADIGMFDFVLPAVIVGVVGILFVWLVAPRILPNRSLPMEEESHRMFSAELHITDESPAAGRYLSDVLAMTEGEMRVERIHRGDTLERKPGATFADDNRDGGEREELLAEVVVTQGSPLYRRSLTDADLATGVDVVPIAVHRSHLSRTAAAGNARRDGGAARNMARRASRRARARRR